MLCSSHPAATASRYWVVLVRDPEKLKYMISTPPPEAMIYDTSLIWMSYPGSIQ